MTEDNLKKSQLIKEFRDRELFNQASTADGEWVDPPELESPPKFWAKQQIIRGQWGEMQRGQGVRKVWLKVYEELAVLFEVHSVPRQSEPGVGARPPLSNMEIPPILLNREAMRRYCNKSFSYNPATAKDIIDKLKDAQQEAERDGNYLTVTRLASAAGCAVETTSRYLRAIKAAGFSELMEVKLPGR